MFYNIAAPPTWRSRFAILVREAWLKAGPTRYPVACSLQAWAAGAPFLLLSALLDLQPDAEHGRLFVEQPILPDWLQIVDIPGIYVGGKSVHLRFVRLGVRRRW